MNLSTEKRLLYLFIGISLFLHLSLIQFILMRPTPHLGSKNPFRLTLNLQADYIAKATSEVTTSPMNQSTNEAKKTQEPASSSEQKNENSEMSLARPSSGWGTKRPAGEITQASISERRNLESRFAQQKMQQINLINSNIAQLVGRLQMMQIKTTCSLNLSEDFAQANLDCTPKQFEGLIKENLAQSHLRWSEKSEFKAATCIPIASLSSERACE